jgi:hypothetical protein
VLIESRYGINSSEHERDYLIQSLRTHSHVGGKLTVVRQFAWYDRDNCILYIYNNDHQIYRLDGKSIDLVSNGTDGVLFLGNPAHEKFTYRENVTGVFAELIIHPINFTAGDRVNLDSEEQTAIFQIWVFTLFFESLQPTKPIQFFFGEKGSGKTTSQQILGQWLFGSSFDVITIQADKEDSFVTAISNNYFVAFDNLDSPVKWMQDRLAQVATGQKIQMRQLYTTNTEVVYFPKCFVSLAAREPKFKRDDVVDRLLLFRVNRIEDGDFIRLGILRDQVLSRRDDLWSEMLDQLNLIVAGFRQVPDRSVGVFRMADFADLGWKIAKIIGGDEGAEIFIELLGKMKQDQSDFLIEGNLVVELIDLWLGDHDNFGREVKTPMLYSELQEVAESNKITLGFKSVSGFGMHLRQILDDLRRHYGIEERKIKRVWHYTFQAHR